MNIVSSFTHPPVVTNQYDFGLYLAPGANDFVHWRFYHSYFAPTQSSKSKQKSKQTTNVKIHQQVSFLNCLKKIFICL